MRRKLTMLAMLLVLSPSWLMGADMPAPAPLFSDNFSSMDPAWGTSDKYHHVEQNKLDVQADPNLCNTYLYEGSLFDNADIRLNVTSASSDATASGGLVFWGADLSNYYVLNIDLNGSVEVARLQNNRWLYPVQWQANDAVKKGAGAVNELRVVTNGHSATIYVNGVKVITFNGQPPQGGGLIGVHGEGANATAVVWQFSDMDVLPVV